MKNRNPTLFLGRGGLLTFSYCLDVGGSTSFQGINDIKYKLFKGCA